MPPLSRMPGADNDQVDRDRKKRRHATAAAPLRWGLYDFAPFIDAATEMTLPLSAPSFFASCFIEAGALSWPNGFDLSAGPLYRRLQEAGALHRDAAAA